MPLLTLTIGWLSMCSITLRGSSGTINYQACDDKSTPTPCY
ncbi:hypothetical protein [Psychrobacter aquimaris]